ncbi:helix-turn-helix domain-containing protein [Duganella radicis]|uniref:Helix-turn-helix domain-containing protein n=1 Tax=Duganella radicis TaxID=551988 RepID=A0A6L6PEC5_9BURK|nr:helix-turn-helix transcriptional regulator [Duganella radicis]MTV36931.1 helix-turn-helix domain-containing protein [Duganella radicis]
MKTPINVQVINGADGKPSFVVIPYDDYIRTYEHEHDLIPNAVVSAMVDGATAVRAWREHLKLTQAEVAGRLGITQPSYAKQEASQGLRLATLKKIATALGVTPAQLDL